MGPPLGTLPCLHHLYIRVCCDAEGPSFLGCDGQSYCPSEWTDINNQEKLVKYTSRDYQTTDITWLQALSSRSRGGRNLEVGPGWRKQVTEDVSLELYCPGPFLYAFSLLPVMHVSSLCHMLLLHDALVH